jgi:hypothetical protein
MSIVKKNFNTIFTVLLISLLTLTGAIPTLAGNKTSESQSTINLSYDATSQNDLQRLGIVYNWKTGFYHYDRIMTDKKEMIRFNLDVSPELDGTLEKLAQKIGGTKSDVLRQAISLMQIAIIAKENGKKVGIVDPNQNLTTEIMIP